MAAAAIQGPARLLKMINAHSIQLPSALAALDVERSRFVIQPGANGLPVGRYVLELGGVPQGIELLFIKGASRFTYLLL